MSDKQQDTTSNGAEQKKNLKRIFARGLARALVAALTACALFCSACSPVVVGNQGTTNSGGNQNIATPDDNKDSVTPVPNPNDNKDPVTPVPNPDDNKDPVTPVPNPDDNKDPVTPVKPIDPNRPYKDLTVEYVLNGAGAANIAGYNTTGITKSSQTAEYLATNLPRNIPTEFKNYAAETGLHTPALYGNAATRGKTYAEFIAQRNESAMLNATSSVRGVQYNKGIYDALDENGYLLRNGEKVLGPDGEYRKIFKHSSALGLYYGNVADSEPAISKKLTYLSRAGLECNQITGIYAPAGEVVKIEISQEDLEATGGLFVTIGQNYPNGNQVAIEWTNPTGASPVVDSTPIGIKGGGYRIEYLCNSYEVKKTVAYVGSFIGGPVYVRPMKNNKSVKFSVTISGGVRYQHFILGSTTPEEYAFNAKSTAPYFDLEIYDNAVRFTSPNVYVKNMTFDACAKAAVLWEKISLTSSRVQGAGNVTSVPIVAIFDCYIAAGAAYANPARNGIVCPVSWMTGALSYDSFVRGGAWGVMHEFNHCWQSYGLPGASEVVNNGVTLAEYLLYTKISSARVLNKNIGGWNRLTDPAQALGECLTLAANYPTTATCGISVYASLLYNIGAENYIAVAHGGKGARAKIYYGNLTETTHYDYSWFFNEVLHYQIGTDEESNSPTNTQIIPQSIIDAARAKNYPMFVPVSSVYAVGRTIKYDGQDKYIKVAQPFEYVSDTIDGDYTMYFGNRNSFAEGAVSLANSGLVIPDGFTVSVKSVTQPANGKVVMLEDNRVKYVPATSELLSGEFKVVLSIKKNDDAFSVDDVEFTVNLKRNNNYPTRTTYVYESADVAKDKYNKLLTADNTLDFGVDAAESILNINSVQNCNTDIWTAYSNFYNPNDKSQKKDYLANGTVLQVVSGVLYLPTKGEKKIALRGRGRIALYLSYDKGETWSLAIDVDNNVTSGSAWKGEAILPDLSACDGMIYFKEVLQVTNTASFCGMGVSTKDDAEDAVYGSVNYLNAYSSEEAIKAANAPFVADYFFKKTYNYSYSTVAEYNESNLNDIQVLEYNGTNTNQYSDSKIFDNNANTVGLSSSIVTSEKTFDIKVDLGKSISAHTLNIYSWIYGGKNQAPADFTLYLGTSREDMKAVAVVENSRLVVDGVAGEKSLLSGTTTTVSFDNQEFRYFKMVIKRSVANHYAAIAGLKFVGGYVYNGVQVAPNAECVEFTGNSWTAKNEACSFGNIYAGENGDFAEFKFTGNRAGFFAYRSADYGTVDIYIDGKLVYENVDLNGDDDIALTYVSDELESGEHTLAVVGKSGKFNIDSFVYWN